MKLHFYLLVAAIAAVPFQTFSQSFQEPMGGEYKIEKGECVSPEQYVRINAMLKENIQELKAKGILPDDWGEASNTNKQKPTAGSFIWPLQQQPGYNYNSVYGISNFVDLNASYPNQLQDWNCGTRTYDLSSGYNHAGIDIFTWPFPQRMQDRNQVGIVAAMAGVIIAKSDGNFDKNCAMGSGQWNAVYVGNTDGTICWYGHMKSGSLTSKIVGQSVAQGEFLGIVGSSGSSTGPHLHFETHTANGDILEPYSGLCNSGQSLWTTQKPYYEPTVNALLTHSAPPVMPNCPTLETINSKDTFHRGDAIIYGSYLHDQDDNAISYQVLDPSNNVFDSWQHGLTSGLKYVASYWYWSKTVTSQMPYGKWTFRATYYNNITNHEFYILDPNSTSVNTVKNGNGANVIVYPNPSSDGNIMIEGLDINSSVYQLSVYDVTGKLIAKDIAKGNGGKVKCELKLSKGMYILSVEDENNIQTFLRVAILD